MPNLPVNIVNRIIREAAVLHGEKSIPKFIFSKAKKQYIYRAKFRKKYLRQFKNIERLLLFKLQNPPEFTMILPTTWMTPRGELTKFSDCIQTPEERDTTVTHMTPAMIVKFPLKITSRQHHWYEDELVYDRRKYSYCSFENGHVFIEKSNDDDDADCDSFSYEELLFRRGYICLDGRIFPIFDMPDSFNSYQETPDQNPNGIDNYIQIKYLEKEIGCKVYVQRNGQPGYNVYDEATQEWLGYRFTRQEANFLVPFYEEPEPDYNY